ncbi:MAG: hypothetical protein K5686_11510 [Lachnospiraceae bacterium]|nr:hypothetical protein [Lachnospiraceae bacterium]
MNLKNEMLKAIYTDSDDPLNYRVFNGVESRYTDGIQSVNRGYQGNIRSLNILEIYLKSGLSPEGYGDYISLYSTLSEIETMTTGFKDKPTNADAYFEAYEDHKDIADDLPVQRQSRV